MINIMKRNLIYLETYYISSKQRTVKKGNLIRTWKIYSKNNIILLGYINKEILEKIIYKKLA